MSDVSGQQPSWRDVTLAAVRGVLGDPPDVLRNVTLPDVYAAVEAQAMRPLSTTWRATIRRSLQELEAAGAISRDERGFYAWHPRLPSQDALDVLLAQLTPERAFDIEDSDYGTTVFHARISHTYDVTLATPHRFDDDDVMRELPGALRDATMALYRIGYRRKTQIRALLVRFDEDGDPTDDGEWRVIVHSDSTLTAAGQTEFAVESFALETNEQDMYEYDAVLAWGWAVREPYTDEQAREERAAKRKAHKKPAKSTPKRKGRNDPQSRSQKKSRAK